MKRLRKIGYTILLLIVALAFKAKSQGVFRIGGMVKDENGTPLPGTTIFLSGTKFAGSADDRGKFQISQVPQGSYKIIFKLLGYELFSKDIAIQNHDADVEVMLKPNATQLKEVVIRPQKNRQKYLKTFIKQFLGSSENASQCILVNPEVIDFDWDKKSKALSAGADEALVIMNKGLGYRITYYLRKFIYNEKSFRVYYEGFPLFEDLPVDKRNNNWETNRENAYNGSLQHFITALYNGNWRQQGFQLIAFNDMHNRGLQNNSRLVSEAKIIDTDTLIAKNRNGTVSFFSYSQLYLVYIKKAEELEYASNGYSLTSIFKDEKFAGSQVSILSTLNPVKIDSQGYYTPTADLQINGYLGWLRVADILPYGYGQQH